MYQQYLQLTTRCLQSQEHQVEATTNLTPDFIFKCSRVSILANIADTHGRQSIEVPHLVMFAVRRAYNRRPMQTRLVNVWEITRVNISSPQTLKRQLILGCATRTTVDLRRNICSVSILSLTVVGTKHFHQASIVFVPNLIIYYCCSETCTQKDNEQKSDIRSTYK